MSKSNLSVIFVLLEVAFVLKLAAMYTALIFVTSALPILTPPGAFANADVATCKVWLLFNVFDFEPAIDLLTVAKILTLWPA